MSEGGIMPSSRNRTFYFSQRKYRGVERLGFVPKRKTSKLLAYLLWKEGLTSFALSNGREERLTG